MFVRNKSGTISIQVIDKSSGKYKVKTIGSCSNFQVKQWIKEKQGLLEIDFNNTKQQLVHKKQ